MEATAAGKALEQQSQGLVAQVSQFRTSDHGASHAIAPVVSKPVVSVEPVKKAEREHVAVAPAPMPKVSGADWQEF